MNVVDSLTVTLGLDSAAFKRGASDTQVALKQTSDAATRTAASMSASGKKAAEIFSAVKIEALSLIGVLLGGKGIEAFVRDATASLAALGRAARNIGMSIPDLAAFANAIERNGGSAAAAQSAFEGYTAAVEAFKLGGNSDLPGYAAAIGANILSDSPMTVFMDFIKFVEEHKGTVEGLQRSRLIGAALGYDPGLVNAALQIGSVANMQKELQQSIELGVPPPEMVARLTQLQHDTYALGEAATYAGNKILNDLEPPLDQFVNWMTQVVEKKPQAIPALAAIAGYLTVIAGLNFTMLLTLLARLSPLVAMAALLIGPSGTSDVSDDELNRIARESEASPSLLGTWWRNNMPSWLGGSPGAAPDLADQSLAGSPEAQAFLKRLSDPESAGDYNLKNGGGSFSDFSKFPEGIYPGGTSTAAGRYQITSETWKEAAAALGLTDFTPASQDRAAWWLAAREYRQKTGRDLLTDLTTGGHGIQVANALKGRWPTITPATGGGGTAGASMPDPRWYPDMSRPNPAYRPAPASNTNSLAIQTLNVHTMATDATGIARDIESALADITVMQANRGLN